MLPELIVEAALCLRLASSGALFEPKGTPNSDGGFEPGPWPWLGSATLPSTTRAVLLARDGCFFCRTAALGFSMPASLLPRLLVSFLGCRRAATVGVVSMEPVSDSRLSLDVRLGVAVAPEGLLYAGLSRIGSSVPVPLASRCGG